ncbi:MAG: metallophosphoesterase family protein, partial [Rhodoferax sp.]
SPLPKPVGPSLFTGSVLLGAPTRTSIALKVYSADQSGSVLIEYGTQSGSYSAATAPMALSAGQPLALALSDLAADTGYYYRLDFQPANGQLGYGSEHSFHTARPSASSFSFTVQADSHLDENSNLDQYRTTLANVLADHADFHIDLGDTFMVEKHSDPLTAVLQMAPDQATVNRRHAYEFGNFGLFAHSVPLFLVNGNHDGELGWLANGTAQVLPVWATLARQSYFLNPQPDGFYSGDTLVEPFVGQRAAWYAWQWGDALFVALDPYWNARVQASKDGWNVTLGERQYQWLTSTLAASTAKYKFIFLHNLTGGLDGQMRGGVEAAPYFEWGGKNLDGSDGFALMRPGWALPIHQLLVRNKVTAVFHGHDHLYARQVLDGIVYQEVPQPSASNNFNGPQLSLIYHYASGTIFSSSGHLRVTVTPAGVTGEYVRAWLPTAETATLINRQIADRWTAPVP